MSLLPSVRRPRERAMVTLEVLRAERLSPSFVRVTLGGAELGRFRPSGPDQAFRMFFRRQGQRRLTMPTFANEAWMAQLIMQPVSRRPWVRMYTVRAIRPQLGELDVEIALHEGEHGPSPATAWALSAAPGDPVGVFDEGYTFRPAPTARRQLLVGDESALPAVLAVLDHASPDLRADVFLEVPTEADIRPGIHRPEGAVVHWLPRDDPALRPGARALEAVRGAELPAPPDYAWVAGESALATGVRRHLVNDRRLPKSAITFTGYWRHGHGSPG
ncbi:siderophore-interacting protein [Streptomyces sp. 8L]|uniref:siderophore-interacting protein n=1 Tax=Streptomyces sp. 8L TaxID=2877242 RepID=UPI001CD49A31|nr:siderophore-interacting protein [Streptomyces sp. 8L]MCA1216995.1 siderophore-interacting protein [Streptomyces sp. 8L]